MGLGDCTMRLILPLGSMISFILLIVAWMIPQAALLTLTPMNKTRLPTVTIGLVGSCVLNNTGDDECSKMASGKYRLDVLPHNTMRDLISPPPRVLLPIIGMSAIGPLLSFVIWVAGVDFLPIEREEGFFHDHAKVAYILECLVKYLQLAAFLFGFAASVAIYTFFSVTCDIFNAYNAGRVDFIASTGSDFFYAWLCIGLHFGSTTALFVHTYKEDPQLIHGVSFLSLFQRKRDEVWNEFVRVEPGVRPNSPTYQPVKRRMPRGQITDKIREDAFEICSSHNHGAFPGPRPPTP